MRSFIVVCMFGVLSTFATAQTLEVISTYPADGDFNVDTDSVVITFDKKLDDSFFYDSTESDFNFFIAPDDSVYYLGANLSADSMSAVFYVELGEDTDYTAYLVDGKSKDGSYLEGPYIFRFTTAADTGQFVVEGTIDQEVLTKVIEEYLYEDIFVALAYEPVSFGNQEDDTSDVRAVFSTLVDKETGDFSIPRVREGEYYPVAFDLFDFDEEEEGFFPLLYFYDVDDDFQPDAIQVDAGSTVNDTLSGVNLVKREITPFTFQEAIEKADSTIADLENEISILGGTTFYASYFGDDEFDDDSTEIAGKATLSSLGIKQFPPDEAHEGDGEPDIVSFPSGYQYEWSVFGYDAVKDSVVNIVVTPFDSFVSGYLGEGDTDLPDTVTFDTFDPLPEIFIDSDSAAYIMEENGGWEFRDRFSGYHSSWEMELEALHNYWEFEPNPTETAPVMWIGRYHGNTYDPFTGFEEEGYFEIYLDIETGEVLHVDSLFGSPIDFALITFGEALDLAGEMIDSLGSDVIIIGGNTFYTNAFFFEDEDEAELKVNPNGPIMAGDGHGGDGEDDDDFPFGPIGILDEPTGEQIYWDIFGYHTVKDSAFSIGVSVSEIEFSGYLDIEETNVPDTIDYASIKPLPGSFIDSDSAAYIIETNGGWGFREEFYGEFSYWEMELEALHNYWEFEPNPTETAPVMWRGRYYGTSFDPFGEFYYEAYLDIYLDIETGELLFKDSLVVDVIDSALITFGEALELAQSVIDSLENDPVILGGSTFYLSENAYDDDGNGGEDFKVVPGELFSMAGDAHDGEDDDHEGFPFDFIFDPSGEQLQWELFGYDAVKDSAFTISVSFFDTEFSGYLGEEDAELPDTVALSSLKEIPESFIDSDSAAYIMEENGGWDFRSEFSDEYGFWTMDLQAIHEYWLFPPNPTEDAPVFWKGSYLGLGFDPITEEYYGGYFVIYLDMETGEVLLTDSEISAGPGDSHITFDDAVELADSLLTNHPNGLELMGGVTRYTNGIVIFKDNPNFQSERFQSKLTTLADDDSPFGIMPDGYAFSWELLAYDPVRDSLLFLNVTEFEVFEMFYAGEDDFEEPIEFDDMDPLPFTHIDSDSAAYLMDEAGAYAFRSNLEDSDLPWTWEAELQLLHNYWEFPQDPTPDAPITWQVEYYAWAFDNETSEFLEDSLTIILDAETGDVLFQSVIVSNEEEDTAPAEFGLSQNYPNPFNPTTTIPFSLREASRVEITVYSILGQKVATIVNEQYPAGSHTVRWDARNLASGMYIYRMQAKGFTQTKKLLLLK